METREQLLAAVRAGVDRAAAGDTSAVLAEAACAEAHHLARCMTGPSDLQAAHVLGRWHHVRASVLPHAAAGPDRDAALRFFPNCCSG
ncbi:hypothetical protein ABZS83_32050 [Streptomyces sp. NPDC005426]|uniref:hypothetical protein n=1 Tax=Streptomyces sp. NPDC005426 TaxID=3155344 RepID=UPI0033BD5EBB